jgi:hypothetical protein
MTSLSLVIYKLQVIKCNYDEIYTSSIWIGKHTKLLLIN